MSDKALHSDDAAFEQTLRQALHARPEPAATADLAGLAIQRAQRHAAAPVSALARTRRWWIAATAFAAVGVVLIAAAALYVPLRNGSFDVFWSSGSAYSTSTRVDSTTDANSADTTGNASASQQTTSSSSYTLDGKLIGGAVLLLAIVAAALQTAVGTAREGELAWRPGARIA